ncbi:transposase, IS4 family [Streptomyces azureus]|uniref:Transposase, IS4 family n=1 Tax=Streptomyces azureus TaxID=146537 RepID=A0A0K8PPY7_STRAJ|nr:transposase, IS4 family [Streptomyces azureus]
MEFTAGPSEAPHPQTARLQLARQLLASLYPRRRPGDFPHATQALFVERYTTGRGDGNIHADAELAATIVPAETADTATLARCVRGQWTIEASTSSVT